MDCIKLSQELNKLVPGWEYHVRASNLPDETLIAFKDEMIFAVFADKDGLANIRGIYPLSFAEAPTNTQIRANRPEVEIAAHVAGVFLPKYQGKFAVLSGRADNAVAQRYSMADLLESASGGFVVVRPDTKDFPELEAHTTNINAEVSVRSPDLIYLDLVVPGDVALEIMKLLAFLKGGSNYGHESDSPGSDTSPTDANQ